MRLFFFGQDKENYSLPGALEAFVKPFRKWHDVFLVQNETRKKLQKAVPSVLDLIHLTLRSCRFSCYLFSLKMDTEDFRKNILLFSYPHQTPPIKCTPASVCELSWCWTLILQDTRQSAQLNPHFPPLRGLLWLSAHCHFPAFLSWPREASRAATVHTQEIFFFSISAF